MALSDYVLKRASEWTVPPYGEDCIKEIKSLIESKNEKELNERFAVELEFGTGGLRGLIRNGTNGMNKYVVARATQGLANYIKKTGIETPSAAVAYDSRLYSREFAMETASVLAANGIKTFIFNELRPVPHLSFAMRELGCVAGIVITASHNPKEYNGYKVFWQDGAQVISPHDGNIIKEVREVETLSDVSRDEFETLMNKGMISWIEKEMDDKFLDKIISLAIFPQEIAKSSVRIVYTPLHGTGVTLIPEALKRLGFNDIIYVEEQMQPDSSFPTVRKPNPEERDALDIAIGYAKRTEADIVIATDPDADRMGIAVRNHKGEFDVLSGNHIGAIMEYYILSGMLEQGTLPSDGAVVKTIVTTELQDRIAESFSMKVFNVLTGFKYIGEKIRHFEESGKYSYVFGGEESYGYLFGTYSRDKDAVASTLMISECCAYLKNRGMTITDYLDVIFKKYGYYNDRNVSIDAEGLKGVEVIGEVMKKFREKAPQEIGGLKVTHVVDYVNDTLYDSSDNITLLPKSNVLQYKLSDGSTVTIRPSGTEPKIKFYFSAKSDSAENTELKLDRMIDDLIPGVKNFIETRIRD